MNVDYYPSQLFDILLDELPVINTVIKEAARAWLDAVWVYGLSSPQSRQTKNALAELVVARRDKLPDDEARYEDGHLWDEWYDVGMEVESHRV
jgi:hypothetical protein